MEKSPKVRLTSNQAPIEYAVRRFAGAVMVKRYPSPVSGGTLVFTLAVTDRS